MGKVVGIPIPITFPKDWLIHSTSDGTLTVSDKGEIITIKLSDLVDTKDMVHFPITYDYTPVPAAESKKIEKLFTLPSDMFSAVDFTSTGVINEHTGKLPSFIVGEKYALKGVACDGFDMKEDVYELIGLIDSFGGVPIESVIVKQVSGEQGNIFTLSKNDCAKLGMEFQQGLQLFPKSLPWVRVIENPVFDPHNLATTPKSVIDNTVRYVLLKLNGFKDYLDGYVITPSGKIIKEEQFESSIRVHSKEPVVYGNGFVRRETNPLKISLVRPKTSIFNHGNFISSDDEVFILITLRNETFNGRNSFDGYFGVDPVYLDGINPNDYFIIRWDELGAKTVEEYEAEKARIEKEHAEAVRREEERIKKEAERKRKAEEDEKRKAEEAVRRMKNMEIRTPSFPKVPKFKTNLEALAGLDLYIDSLDAYFKGLDREFSKVNFDLSGMADMLRMGSNASIRRTRDMFFI
jgi:hypothetical protein